MMRAAIAAAATVSAAAMISMMTRLQTKTRLPKIAQDFQFFPCKNSLQKFNHFKKSWKKNRNILHGPIASGITFPIFSINVNINPTMASENFPKQKLEILFLQYE